MIDLGQLQIVPYGELFFLIANMIVVLPINCSISYFKPDTNDLNSVRPSKKWTGNTNVSFSSFDVDLKIFRSAFPFNLYKLSGV